MAKESRIEILKGNDSGAQFRITGSRVRLGRATDSDIVITDSSASRNHAELIKMNESFIIKDLNSSNGVYVNGKKVNEHYLTSGDVFSIGTHEYRYIETETAGPRSSAGATMRNSDGTIPGLSRSSFEVNVPSAAGGGPNKRFVIYGAFLVIIGAVMFMMFSGDDKTKTGNNNNGNSALGQNNNNDDALFGDSEEEKFRKKIPEDERELFDTANAHYFEGQREFRLQNYSRALEEFRKALSFYPQHARAKTAAGQTSMKIDEESQKYLSIGKKMYTQRKYEDALRHFNGVLNLNVRQPSSPLYKEAEKWKERTEKRKGEVVEQ